MCGEKNDIFKCESCSQGFGHNDFNTHRQELSKQLEELEVTQNIFQQTETSKKIGQLLFKQTVTCIDDVEIKLADQLRQIRPKNDYVELNFSHWKKQLTEPNEELAEPSNITIQQDSIPSVHNVYVTVSIRPLHCFIDINLNTKWKKNGITVVVGGNGQGKLNQLSFLQRIYVDDDQTIYIDSSNDHIMDWKGHANNGQIVAGGNEEGNKQLRITTDVIIDIKNDPLIICDNENRQRVLWSFPNGTIRTTIITDIDCWGLTMDKNGYLYVSHTEKHEVDAIENKRCE